MPESLNARALRALSPAPALAQLERWFVQAPLRLVLAAVLLSVLWSSALALGAAALRIERPVVSVVTAAPPAAQARHVLFTAPLVENAVLWLVLAAALFCLRQWWPARAAPLSVGLAAALFALAHAPVKVLYGAEVLMLGVLMSLCFLWGARHRRPWRGYALSVAMHLGVNLVAFGLLHGTG